MKTPHLTVTTYTGKHFNPVEPEADKIDIRDIAHALSMTCRGNGHVKTYFSVGQHCINCAREAQERGYSPRMILACLLHDAGEAYMSDVPRPLKPFMPQYVEAEERLLQVIYGKYLGQPISPEEEKMVREIDDDLLYYDMKELFGEILDREAPELRINLDYTVVPFEQVEGTYLKLFKRWINKENYFE